MSLKYIANEPWAMTEAGLQLVVAVASRDEFFADVREKALAALDGKPLENTRSVSMRGDVAVIPIEGPLFRKANLLTALSGATSYDAIAKDLRAALDSQQVGSILLEIDSPGGEAKGVSELAQMIVEARKTKPVKAYVGGMGASAAYWIASAASEVVISDTAQLGSIGVIAAYSNEEDPKTIEFVSSQSPYKNAKPNTETGRAKIQDRIDALADVFIGAVASNRNVSRTAVMERFGKGDVLVGEAAAKAGLADRIGTFESVVAGMKNQVVSFGRSRISASDSSKEMSLAEFGRMEIA